MLRTSLRASSALATRHTRPARSTVLQLHAQTSSHGFGGSHPLLRRQLHSSSALFAAGLDDERQRRRADRMPMAARLVTVTSPLVQPLYTPHTRQPLFHAHALAVYTSSLRGFNTSTNANEPATTVPLSPTEAAAAKKRVAAARRRRRSKIKAQEEKLVSALEKGGERQLIRVNNLDQQLPKVSQEAVSLIRRVPQLTVDGAKALGRGIQLIFTDPAAVKAWLGRLKDKVKAELKHYWVGSKLLYADVTTSTRILRRLLRGNALSRRERKQLQRTVADLVRLVPFAFFVIVPFMELLLPVALKMFPNMLPSTFKDSFQREEDMKRQLQLRVALAEFLQDTVKDVMQDTRDTEGVTEERKATASEVMDFIERAQKGDAVSADETLKVATLFNDELMLDNISRPQLVAMCRYMGVQPYGNDNFLRFQLRNRVRQLKKDDQDIIWEGLDSLDKEELQQACMERGMRATGLTKAGYMRQMRQWLDLSINKNVPTSLLIMSRALNITAMDNPEAALATSLSSMDEEVVTEVALSATTAGTESLELRELKLESIRYQNEMIADEEKFRSEGKKKADEEAAAAEAAAAKVIEVTEGTDAAAAVVLPSEPVASADKVASPVDTGAAADASATGEPAPATPPKSIADIVSLEELMALESLAFKSIVAKERQAVDQMKQNKSEMDVEGLLAAGRIGTQSRENKTAGRLMKRLDVMLSNLEVELEKVDRDVGDRLNILDRDSDGMLTAEEFKTAVMTILRKTNTEEDVEWVISQIDHDQDGRIALEELMAWVEKCRDVLEATGQIPLETPVADAAAAAITTALEAESVAKATVKRTSSRKN
ncbi:hypothetical protein Poli38472_008983 [Pythium oligandrum]|uniref:Mitochondrial proton/calcium exchanger protein n=1 Tax=Pythium oligandrum TaxID=41045 RepID=A0A8K1FJD9_PYTOL|nr:hypothetical protein Poli38472_008983 [Pythium oligandrum]|eukprot:TMW64816.1 hypothetical protein Poli38472_008983 [Pythium oligandrum]